ncbi:toll/interleukin-1 receptor domain-containing protein [Nocardioides dilutus]|jgi:nucleoside 2-deoxyribosyltransferase
MRVFLSHATSDADLAAAVKSRLGAVGMQVYLAEHDNRAGENVHAKIQDRIKRSDIVIALLTPAADASRYVHQEIGFAVRAKKLIVPVVTPAVASAGLGMLDGTEYIVIDEQAPTEALLKLSQRVVDRQAKTRQEQLDAAMLVVAIGLVLVVMLEE